MSGNLARRVVQEAAERFGVVGSAGTPATIGVRHLAARGAAVGTAACRSAAPLGPAARPGRRGRSLLGRPESTMDDRDWRLLVDDGDFDGAAQEAALMLLLQAGGMVEMRELIREVAEVLASSGWRDTGNGAPPTTVTSAAPCGLWSAGANFGPWWRRERGRASRPGSGCPSVGGEVAMPRCVTLALRPRMDPD